MRDCFDDLGGRRVTASCSLADDTSWRLMERLGMRRQTHAVRESLQAGMNLTRAKAVIARPGAR